MLLAEAQNQEKHQKKSIKDPSDLLQAMNNDMRNSQYQTQNPAEKVSAGMDLPYEEELAFASPNQE